MHSPRQHSTLRELILVRKFTLLCIRLLAFYSESLSTVPEKGGRPRLSTKRHLHHRVETSVHDSPLETTLSEYRLEYERSEKGDPATGVRVYGLPWIGRLGGQKGSSKPDSQKPLQPKNRK